MFMSFITLTYIDLLLCIFFFNDTATTEIYTLSLHDALPIFPPGRGDRLPRPARRPRARRQLVDLRAGGAAGRDRVAGRRADRSEGHTSELQSRQYFVCRLLVEKKKHPRQFTA